MLSCSLSTLDCYTSAIADSGTANYFIATATPTSKIIPQAKQIRVRVTNGQIASSSGVASLNISSLPRHIRLAYIMPGFLDSLFSIGNLCDAGFHCTFTLSSVCAYDPKTNIIKLQG